MCIGKKSPEVILAVGDRVFLLKPSEKTGEARRPYAGVIKGGEITDRKGSRAIPDEITCHPCCEYFEQAVCIKSEGQCNDRCCSHRERCLQCIVVISLKLKHTHSSVSIPPQELLPEQGDRSRNSRKFLHITVLHFTFHRICPNLVWSLIGSRDPFLDRHQRVGGSPTIGRHSLLRCSGIP